MSDERLRGLVRAIQSYSTEIADAVAGRRAVYDQAKAMGYDTRTIRNSIRRMAMNPEDRDAADQLLADYECKLGVEGSATPLADARPARKRERFVAPPDASAEDQLRGFITRVLELRGERGGIGDAIKLELRKAKAAGFDTRKITEACMWLEKCDRHGREQMLLSEELYQIYRDIGDGPPPEIKVQGDSKLVEMFTAPAPEAKKEPSQKLRQVSDAIAAAQISRMMRGN